MVFSSKRFMKPHFFVAEETQGAFFLLWPVMISTHRSAFLGCQVWDRDLHAAHLLQYILKNKKWNWANEKLELQCSSNTGIIWCYGKPWWPFIYVQNWRNDGQASVFPHGPAIGYRLLTGAGHVLEWDWGTQNWKNKCLMLKGRSRWHTTGFSSVHTLCSTKKQPL